MNWPQVVEIIKDVWWVISAILGAVGLIGMLYLRNQFPTRAQHDALTSALQKFSADLTERVAGTELQVAKLEADMHQMPNRQEVASLGDRISRVERDVAISIEMTRGVDKTVAKIDATLALILKHMLETPA